MCERRGGVAAAAGRWRWSSVAWRASCRGNAVAPGWSSWTTRRTPSSRHHSSPAPDFRQETAATWRHRTPTTTTTMTSLHFRLTSSENTPVSAQFKSHLQTLSTATIFPQYFADETRVLSIRYYIIALTLIADAQRDEEAGSVKWIAEITNGNGASSVRKDNQRPSQNENGTAQLGHRTGCRRLRWLGLVTHISDNRIPKTACEVRGFMRRPRKAWRRTVTIAAWGSWNSAGMTWKTGSDGVMHHGSGTNSCNCLERISYRIICSCLGTFGTCREVPIRPGRYTVYAISVLDVTVQ